MKPTREPKLDGPFFSLPLESDSKALVPELRLDPPPIEGTGYCFGPGLTAADVVPKVSGLVAMQRLYVTPIDDERIELRGIVNAGKLHSDEATAAFARELSEAVFEQWEHDRWIWKHKLYRKRPALHETEPAITVFRKWYAQFYA